MNCDSMVPLAENKGQKTEVGRRLTLDAKPAESGANHEIDH